MEMKLGTHPQLTTHRDRSSFGTMWRDNPMATVT
jgi:hypothetical protein